MGGQITARAGTGSGLTIRPSPVLSERDTCTENPLPEPRDSRRFRSGQTCAAARAPERGSQSGLARKGLTGRAATSDSSIWRWRRLLGGDFSSWTRCGQGGAEITPSAFRRPPVSLVETHSRPGRCRSGPLLEVPCRSVRRPVATEPVLYWGLFRMRRGGPGPVSCQHPVF